MFTGLTCRSCLRPTTCSAICFGRARPTGAWASVFPDALRLMRFRRCLVLFVTTQHEPDRLILAPEAVVTTAAAHSCADRESLTCQRVTTPQGNTSPTETRPNSSSHCADDGGGDD
jgi:hypothetical protein